MTTTIAVVSDTHCHSWSQVHPDIRRAVSEADIAVHCGDFSRMNVVDGIRREARRAVVVHGNSDAVDIRRTIPYVEELEVEDKRIGVTHPAWGGPPFELTELLGDFPRAVDLLLFGHLHDPVTRSGTEFTSSTRARATRHSWCRPRWRWSRSRATT